MKHITYFKQMMNDVQEINLAEKGVTFTEAAFTQLYDQSMAAINLQEEYLESFLDGFSDGAIDTFKEVYDNGVKKAKVKGIMIGVVGTGVGIGLNKTYKKIKNRKADKETKEV